MIDYMLSKLESLARESIILQQAGDFAVALAGYELAFEALRYYEGLGYSRHVENVQRLVLEAQPTQAMTLYLHALIQFHLGRYICALESVKAALMITPDAPAMLALKGRIQTAVLDFTGASDTFKRIRILDPLSSIASDGVFMLAAEQEMPGPDYYDWLQKFHQWLQPSTYVEIGLGHGRSLALAGRHTKAIGIDPYQGFWERLNYISPHAPATLFPLTSDVFFEQHDLRVVMEQGCFDLGFIDGLHLFEQVLKDFINLERYARKDSVILIHDCLPIAPIVAERERCTGFWTGDVWRIIPCLKAFRPDLRITTIPTKPSGLGVVTNLDAKSTVLSDSFDEIVRYYLTLGCPESFLQRCAVCNVEQLDAEGIKENICTETRPVPL
ncbi:MAG: class I SAM-dependent methyltransferase [Desulfuromonadales bacterium]